MINHFNLSNNLIFRKGKIDSKILLILNFVGSFEKKKNILISGENSVLLDKILSSINILKSDILILNFGIFDDKWILNRDQNDKTSLDKLNILKEYINLIEPLFIINMSDSEIKLDSINQSYVTIDTYSPNTLIKSPHLKRDTWEKLKEFKAKLYE